MKNYSYTAKDSSGKTVKGIMEVESTEELLERLRDKGLFCMTYAEAIGKGAKTIKKFNTKDLSFACRQMSAMMSSGLSLVKALDILAKEQEKKAYKLIWQNIYEEVQKGQSLSEACASLGGVFPDFFLSMIGAGESSGMLDMVMNRLSEHYLKENKLNNKIKGAMTYPIVLLVLCFVLVIGMFTFILPQFKGLMGEGEMPALTAALFSFSEFIIAKWYILLIAIFIIVVVIIYVLKIPSTRLKIDKFILICPKVGKLLTTVYTGRFARTMSSLYSSGIPMVECLERSSRVLGNSYIDKAFEKVVDDVKQGTSISKAISETEIFESMFCSIIYVGEESGALDSILEKTAEYYEDEADTAIGKLVGLMEPLMIIIMGCAVACLLAAIFPMLYGNMENLG